MNKTNIEYLDFTWNPIAMRCTPISEGCLNCWHIKRAKMLSGNPNMSGNRQRGWKGGKPHLSSLALGRPHQRQKSAKIGVQFMGDLFHDAVPFEYVDEILVRGPLDCKHHTFIILTKRPENILKWMNSAWWRFAKGEAWPKNIWLGVTVEKQKRADERIALLLQIPTAVRFVSVEPMLGKINLNCLLDKKRLVGHQWFDSRQELDWVICGAETGSGKRPMDIQWARDLRDQCIDVGIPFFFKRDSGGPRTLDGKMWEEYPS